MLRGNSNELLRHFKGDISIEILAYLLFLSTSARLFYVDWTRLEIELEVLPFWYLSIVYFRVSNPPEFETVVYFVAELMVLFTLFIAIKTTRLRNRFGIGDIYLILGLVVLAPAQIITIVLLSSIINLGCGVFYTKVLRGKKRLLKHIAPAAPGFLITGGMLLIWPTGMPGLSFVFK